MNRINGQLQFIRSFIHTMIHQHLLHRFHVIFAQGITIVVLATLPLHAAAQDTMPVDEADETMPVDETDELMERQVVNCMATATPDYVEWGHRYTYWLSGVAQFDNEGNMQPILDEHAGDWILTVTNSRFAPLETYTVLPVQADRDIPDFSFPAVSLQEWNDIEQQPTREYVTAFSYDDASHGLYLGIRNTAVDESPRQLFQVVHYLSDDYAMISGVSACFVGPRPMVIGHVEVEPASVPSHN